MASPSGSEYRASRFRTGPWAIGSIVVVLVLAVLLFELDRQGASPGEPAGRGDSGRGPAITVYCAAGIRLPVEELAKSFEDDYGTRVDLRYNSSGGLLSTIELKPEGDLYIPADADYIERGRTKELIEEAIPLARFRLVVATKPGNPRSIGSLDDLLAPDLRLVVCNPEAGAGKTTREVLEKAGRWTDFDEASLIFKPTVPDAASAVKTSDTVDAGFIWDSTARQYGLEIVDLPELSSGVATIEAGVLRASTAPAAALRFARFLAAPETGNGVFKKHGYEPMAGDPWTEIPELLVFCGGVNRDAVRDTLAEFEKREGCRLNVVYNGCGVLVGQIEASAEKPGLFLTCDASYLTMVKDLFLDASDVSETEIVILVRDGNAEIRSLEDLARPGLSIGITEPRASALGHLSVELLKELGLWERVAPNIKVHAPTAHELILQVEASDKLDLALVYRANCQNVGEGLRIVPIDHPKARAVQNMAASRDTRFPQLVDRLFQTLISVRSRDRFRSHGFEWRAEAGPSDSAGATTDSSSPPSSRAQ